MVISCARNWEISNYPTNLKPGGPPPTQSNLRSLNLWEQAARFSGDPNQFLFSACADLRYNPRVMWKTHLALSCLILLLASAPCRGQQNGPCKIAFSVVTQDQLDNIHQGLSDDDLKWLRKKVEGKYPGICYVPPDTSVPYVFFISVEDSKVLIDGTTSNRPMFVLSFERKEHEGKFTVLHNFRETDCPICHPKHAVIEDAVKWIAAGGMNDQLQSVPSPQ